MKIFRKWIEAIRFLFYLTKIYESDRQHLHKEIQKLNERMGKTEVVHCDIHYSKPTQVICIGQFQGRDYVRAFTVSTQELDKLIHYLKEYEKMNGGRFDEPYPRYFSSVYKTDRK